MRKTHRVDCSRNLLVLRIALLLVVVPMVACTGGSDPVAAGAPGKTTAAGHSGQAAR